MSNSLVDYGGAVEFLLCHDDYIILTHRNPDGDAFGSAFALHRILNGLGKRSFVSNMDGFPARYAFLYEGCRFEEFVPKTIISVDLADEKLLGSLLDEYSGKIKLNIDHHASNTLFAEKTLLDPKCAAAGELIFELSARIGCELDSLTAASLYTAIATDTGCFKFSNTTPRTHEIVAELMRHDFNFAKINREMFDIKSLGKIRLESAIYANTEYYLDGRCAIAYIPRKLVDNLGVEDAELDTTMSLPLQTQGVLVGITVKERVGGGFKASMRSCDDFSVSDIANEFGGGGHRNAAGCEFPDGMTIADIKKKIIEIVGEKLGI